MSLSRRRLFAELGALAAASRLFPARVLAQDARPAVAPGKEQLIVRSLRPPDYESPVVLLDAWLTPVENFYVRSPLPVPAALDAASWTLQIDGEVAAPVALSLNDLRRLPAATLTATLECAGNGRSFYDPPVAGVQ